MESETRTAPPEQRPTPDSGEAPPKDRPKTKTVRDMLLSMAIITAGAYFLFLFVPNDASQDPVQEVEYETEAQSAARAAPYELVAPEGLPDDWRATSVRYQHQSDHGSLWRLGFVDPDNEYVAVAQADGAEEPFVAELTQQADPTGETVRIGGRDWERYTGTQYDGLVHVGPEATTLVTGTAGAERLEVFADALEARETESAEGADGEHSDADADIDEPDAEQAEARAPADVEPDAG